MASAKPDPAPYCKKNDLQTLIQIYRQKERQEKDNTEKKSDRLTDRDTCILEFNLTVLIT